MTDVYAPSLTPGHEALPIRDCKFCGGEIVWCKSKRTGKHYPVSVTHHGKHDARKYGPWNVHKCREDRARRETEAAKTAEVDALVAKLDQALEAEVIDRDRIDALKAEIKAANAR